MMEFEQQTINIPNDVPLSASITAESFATAIQSTNSDTVVSLPIRDAESMLMEIITDERNNEDLDVVENPNSIEENINNFPNQLPQNSPTLLMDDTVSRFSSAIWYEKMRNQSIILAGLGGIGSYVGFLLARLKPHVLYLYDPDIVELGNLSGQFYSKSEVNKYKVTALYDKLTLYANYYDVSSVRDRYIPNSRTEPIMICGFDNMLARRIFYVNWKTVNRGNSAALFIDGRLAAEEFQILCIRGDDEYNMKRYEEEFLFSDAEADVTECSYKQTSFVANMIASFMVNLVVNHVANMCDTVMLRDLPFLTSYRADLMMLKTMA